MKQLCRLCLKSCGKKSKDNKIDEIITDQMDVLSIKLNWNTTKDPVICGQCTECLDKSFMFKSTCFYTEEYLFPFITSECNMNTGIDLKELYITDQNLTGVESLNCKRICRFCMDFMADEHFIRLSDIDDDVLQKCLPELNLLAVKDPLICNACHDSLKSYANFIDKCKQTEEKINRYRQVRAMNRNGFLALNTVVQYLKQNEETTEETETESNVKEVPDIRLVKHEKIHYGVVMVRQDLRLENGKIKHVTRKKRSIKYHYTKEEMERRKFACPLCTYRSSNRHTLKKHELTHTDFQGSYACDVCTYKGQSQQHVIRHMTIHNKVQPKKVVLYKKCPYCDFKAQFASIVRVHVKRIHPANGDCEQLKKYKCDLCSYRTQYRSDLGDHMRKHEDKCKYKCKECFFQTKYIESFKRHSLLHKDPSELKFLQCAECDFKTWRKSQIQVHIRRAHMDASRVAKYKCDVCDHRSFYKTDFDRHVMMHKKEKTLYKCDRCQYVTVRRKLLVRHSAVHQGQKEGSSMCSDS